MLLFNFNKIKKKLYKFSSYKIFILSFIICLSFYLFEGILGIDRFYHPDSSHYLKQIGTFSLAEFLESPLILVRSGYYIVTDLLYNNYYLLILLNFIIYSFTNVLIFQKVYKKYFKTLSNTKLFFLFYLFFLDPYRLHLASHILKETILIFIIIGIVLHNSKIIKFVFILCLEIFRKNSWIYLLIFITFSNIKENLKKKFVLRLLISFLVLLITFILLNENSINLIKNIYNFIELKLRWQYVKVFPVRSYDHVSQFKDYGFPIGFILKNLTWPIMLISGFFMFFVSSLLFKFLGIIILFNNLLVYIITKKTFISLGLFTILIMISVYTASYTAMFRYSYVAIYASLIYFFLNLKINNNKVFKK